MTLAEGFAAELFAAEDVLRLRARDKAAAMAAMAARAEARGIAGVLPALAAREALGSTGIGHGVALPHARLTGLAAPVGILARLDRAIDWQAIDGRKVDLVCLLVTRAEDPEAHLACLAAISRRLREPAAAAAMRAAGDAARLRAALLG